MSLEESHSIAGFLVQARWYRCHKCEMSMLISVEEAAPTCYRCGEKVFVDAN